jgi:uncharacterized membrane protein HdeD (DUF308 family)
MSMSDIERRSTLETQRIGDEMRDAVKRWTDKWWIFAVVGVAWLLVALLVLRFDTASLATVGALLGAVFLLTGLDEFFIAYVRPPWRWAHFLLGVAFVAGAVWCLVRPVEAFWALAAVFGLLLILRGSLDLVASTISRLVNPLWGLGLLLGILEILLGFWASQQFVAAQAALVLLWVGFFAMMRGISAIVLAFEIRSIPKMFEHDRA